MAGCDGYLCPCLVDSRAKEGYLSMTNIIDIVSDYVADVVMSSLKHVTSTVGAVGRGKGG